MTLRQIAGTDPVLYLTFDDGPHPTMTPPVLDLLAENKIQATFFLVAERAAAQKQMVQEILSRGHSIGNHSLDHSYSVFFRGQKAMTQWIQQSEDLLAQIGISESVGFRPPNGIVTPELRRALHALKIPLILWNCRFYDSLWPWTQKRASRSLQHMEKGSIVLLHDVQREKNFSCFLKTLQFYIEAGQAQGFYFRKLEPRHREIL